MGLALHELCEVSGLVIRDAPYEDYVPTTEELHLLKKEDPQVYETYWEMLCHFHICGQISIWRNRGVKQMSCASYLFKDINEKSNSVTSLVPYTDEEIAERINASISSYMTESNEDTFKPDTAFESFHYQARIPISDRTLLAGFLILWLKRCVVPTLSHEVIVADVVYLAVLLVHGKLISLLQAMVVGIQSGLMVMTKNLCQVEAIVDSQGR